MILNATPASSSTKQSLHYCQSITSGIFRWFDYGIIKNKEYYHTRKPPIYNISKITAPVGLFYSENDQLSPIDVRS